MGTQQLNDALRTVLSEHFGREVEFTRPPERLTGGYSTEIHAFELVEPRRRFVLRLVANDAQAEREARFQSILATHGYPVPTVELFGGSSSALARAFLVMERADGKGPLESVGPLGVVKLFRAMPVRLADLMAALHRVPPDDAPADDGAMRLVAGVEHAGARRWLEAHAGATSPVVICHGDLHGANLLLRDDAVTAVLDWELACVAPAELDVARTALILAMLPGVPRAARLVLSRSGQQAARRFVDHYAARGPLDRDALRWFDVAHCARLLAIARQPGPVAEVWRPLTSALEARLARTMQ